MDVAAWRRETRSRLIEKRLSLPAPEHRRASLAVETLLEGLLAKIPPRVISAYWPFKAEVDLRPLLGRLQTKGWTTSLPSVVKPRTPLEFLRWTPDSEMVPGVYGIPVPSTRDVVVPDIVILPLVGFDSENYRLGYGGGFFDVTLAGMHPRPRSIGVGFELGHMDTIHPQVNDIPLDLILTEGGTQGDTGSMF